MNHCFLVETLSNKIPDLMIIHNLIPLGFGETLVLREQYLALYNIFCHKSNTIATYAVFAPKCDVQTNSFWTAPCDVECPIRSADFGSVMARAS